MSGSVDLETRLGEALRSAAGGLRPPVEDLVRAGERRGVALRRRRSRYGVALAGGVGVAAAAIFAIVPRLGPGAPAPSPAGPATATAPAAACATSPDTGPLPDWASTGFSDPQAGGTPFVVGAQGSIAAILFGELSAPEAKDHGNKVLWVSRRESAPLQPLEIDARLGGSGPVVHREVAGGPGPSSVDLPEPGCWQLALTWDGGRQHDTMELSYVRP